MIFVFALASRAWVHHFLFLLLNCIFGSLATLLLLFYTPPHSSVLANLGRDVLNAIDEDTKKKPPSSSPLLQAEHKSIAVGLPSPVLTGVGKTFTKTDR